MNHNIELLRNISRVVLIITAVAATSFPVVYSTSRWRTRAIGRVIMMLGLSLALALDLTVLFTFWTPRDFLIRFWINMAILSVIAWACFKMTWTVWRLNHPRIRKVNMILSSGVYDKMKFLAQIVLPAAGTLYFAIAGIWGLPNAEEVSGTVLAVDTFLGVLLGISSSSYKASGAAYDGTMVIEPHEDGSSLRLQSVDLQALASKQEITFKVVQPPAA